MPNFLHHCHAGNYAEIQNGPERRISQQQSSPKPKKKHNDKTRIAHDEMKRNRGNKSLLPRWGERRAFFTISMDNGSAGSKAQAEAAFSLLDCDVHFGNDFPEHSLVTPRLVGYRDGSAIGNTSDLIFGE